MQVTEPMVRLVDLLMREEGEDTAIEEIDEPSVAPAAATVLVDASGHQAAASVPIPSNAPVAQVDSEDEEEMLLEV